MQDLIPALDPSQTVLQREATRSADAVTRPSSNPASSLAGDFNTFLTLLTTQLQNQDPLDPLDTENFTQQLVQFAGVEQQISTNSNLETLIGLQSSVDRFGALSLIGADVELATNDAFSAGDGAAWRFTAEAPGETLTARIQDAAGRTVRETTIEASPGAQSFVWNGRDERGDAAPAGAYSLVLTRAGAEGAAAQRVEAFGVTRVNAVDVAGEAAQIETALGGFSLNDIRRISRANLSGA